LGGITSAKTIDENKNTKTNKNKVQIIIFFIILLIKFIYCYFNKFSIEIPNALAILATVCMLGLE